MLYTFSTIVGMLAAVASTSPTKHEKRLSNSLGQSLGIKSNSMISYDGVYFGYAPNYDPSVTMLALNGATG
ncbi:uncharacterized protein PAC_12695 [Phialocephala subalpina]|uniref:Uncharacterized protein n=1 Tax=Phialocephala subalpina TaxID=576137 RepID=A0A1L7XCQ3_9HELO|nr:uncharacterized protein PAC_12695 [Phialocephala subalpina]